MSDRPSPEARRTPIVIVGAGPGGLSLARILTDRGFANITLVERSRRVGGKTLTFHHEGIGHELGACYTTWGYTLTHEWMREAGITAHRLPTHVIHLPDGRVIDFKEFVLGDHKVRAYGQIAEYNQRWLAFFRNQQLMVDEARWIADVARPFGRWLDDHGLDVVKRFAWRTMTAMGYGHLDAVPALYGLRWNTPSLLLSAAMLRVDEPVPGWQHLWQHLAWHLDVRTDTHIQRVQRSEHGHVIHTDRGELRASQLVVTSPLDEARSWLPMTDEERDVFGRIRWSEYVSTLVQVEGWFRNEDTHTYAANLYGADGDRRGGLMVARRTGDKTPVARARSTTRPDLYVCYQYGVPGASGEDLLERLQADIRADGGRVVTVHRQARWRYAPQLDSDAIAQGYAWRLEGLQGVDDTWYTGASLSHEAIDSIVDYNQWLADRMELRMRRKAGETLDPDWLDRRRRRRLRSLDNK
ncbi:MAG: hypothetical protein D6798_06800 [Deltaproteobacteria bacterium]|nr:MAG: hypothetical protein D6798_06800 [Deltaproteobacteria bacterium]